MVIQSLGWDPRHHVEIRKSPENKIHIRKVVSRVPEKFGKISTGYRKILEGFGGPHLGGHKPRRAHMDQWGVQQPTWAGRTQPQRPIQLHKWKAPKTLGAALGGKFPLLAGPR